MLAEEFLCEFVFEKTNTITSRDQCDDLEKDIE